jgi:excisionase family DNA binding protein
MPKVQNRVPQFLTKKQVSERLCYSERSIDRWVKTGLLHAHYLGESPRFSEEDVATFVNARRR